MKRKQEWKKAMKVPKHLPLPIQLLLVSAFLMNIGQFAILSFLAVYLTTTLHETPWQVGTILGLNLFCARALPPVTGIIADRTRHELLIIAGILIRGIGYLVYACFHSFPLLICASCLTGIGTALYSPSINVLFSAQEGPLRTKAFTRFNQALNLGAVLGPFVGSLLLLSGATIPFLVSGGLFLGIAGVLFALRHLYQTEHVSAPLLTGFTHVWQQKHFLAFALIMILFWMMYTQLTLSFPLQAFRASHQIAKEGLILSINGIAGTLLMLGLGTAFQKMSAFTITRIGILCTGIGLGLVALFPSSYLWLILCITIYTLGETLVLPGSNMVIAELSESTYRGAFFGISSLSWAIGGVLGSYLGTWLMAQSNLALPWLIYASFGLLAFLFMTFLKHSS